MAFNPPYDPDEPSPTDTTVSFSAGKKMLSSVPFASVNIAANHVAVPISGMPVQSPDASAVKTVMTALALRSDATASKYHQSKTVLLTAPSFGESKPEPEDVYWEVTGPVAAWPGMTLIDTGGCLLARALASQRDAKNVLESSFISRRKASGNDSRCYSMSWTLGLTARKVHI